MNLIFAETANRQPCGYEIRHNELLMPCVFSSALTVTIPAGLRFFEGSFKKDADAGAKTFPICKNHEGRIRGAFEQFLKN